MWGIKISHRIPFLSSRSGEFYVRFQVSLQIPTSYYVEEGIKRVILSEILKPIWILAKKQFSHSAQNFLMFCRKSMGILGKCKACSHLIKLMADVYLGLLKTRNLLEYITLANTAENTDKKVR